MKLHLPTSLFRSLLAAMSAAAALTCSYTAEAATLHKDISLVTYADFGQNMGRYVVGNTSALQTHLSNTQGVQIVYTGGQDPVTLPHGMIDFGSASSAGNTALLGYNWMATVQHVNWGISTNYSARYIGADNAIQYKEIICWGSPSFSHNPQTDGTYSTSTDYRISRINKLVTDVDGSTPFYGDARQFTGELVYRVGAGYTYKEQEDGSAPYIGMPITGGVDTILSINNPDRYQVLLQYDSSSAGVGEDAPAPFFSEPGDSGSPAWVWNTETERYEYIGALNGANSNYSAVYRGVDEWTKTIMEKYDVSASVAGGSTIHLSAVNTPGETISDEQNSTTLYSGAVTDAEGNELARYNGVQSGLHTWNDLSGLKDTQQWYAYDDSYMNSADVPTTDLFYTSNLILSATSAEKVSIVLDATVDLGVGYVQFKPATEGATAEFDISSAAGENHLLNSAGFIVEKGASVHLNLTNPSDYMREWRKVGEGDLYIEGSGNNDIFLNVGGAGKTYLARTGGYAAYNVLVNNGSTIVINDINQIKRDLTFGNRGGTLDMNGKSLYWNNDNDATAQGFTIHALDEQAIITNNSGSSTLTWTQGGEQTWLGSFVDSTQGALKFVYDSDPLGEAPSSRLVMHSIHTDLSNNASSGMEVWSGTLVLQGRNTVHAENSLTGSGGTRYFDEDDWHYADAKANVTVLGGTFELGSHARLTGNVNVQYGTFIMREGVKHQMEYIEGGYVKENTDNIRDFFGLKGNVKLASGTQMLVQFSEGTDSTLVYEGDITGTGNVTIELGAQGTLYLTSDKNTFSGTKNLISGGLYVTSANGAGDTTNHKWLIGKDAWFASESFTSTADIESAVEKSSTGVLALTHSITDDLTAAGYTDLIVGAAEGKEVHYGSTTQSLTAVDGKWTLGGGGGNLIVDFLLEGDNTLVLGNEYGKGNVHLTNTNNTFSGGISFAGGVTLTAEEGALGHSSLVLSYTNRLMCEDASIIPVMTPEADGVLLLDSYTEPGIDLSSNSSLTLGSEGDCRYSGNITVAEGAAYRFGGSTGVFTVDSALEAGHDVVIDGQSYEGGTVVLTNAQAVDGAVSVIGRDTTKTNLSEGNVTLGFESDNALVNASSFTVKDGGNIDLMGTQQQLNNITIAEGSTLGDSVGNGVATLNGSATLEGTITAGHVVKTGDGALSLGGTNNATRFEILGGAATLMSSTATNANGTLAVSNASLELNGQTVNGTIELGDGASLTNMNTVGTLHVVGDSQGSCRNADGTLQNARVTIDTLNVEAGASFRLDADSATWSTVIGSLQGAGDVELQLNQLSLSSSSYLAAFIRGNNSSFSGHLSIVSDPSVTLAYYGAGVRFGNYNSFGTGVVTYDGAQFFMDTVNTADTAIQATLDVGERGVYLYTSGAYFTGLSGTGKVMGGTATFMGDMTDFSGIVAVKATYGGEGVNYHTVTGNTSPGAINLFASNAARLSDGKLHTFNYEDDVILNATVVGTSQVTQAGTGTLVISEANTSTGKLTVNEGSTVWLGENGSWAGKLAGAGTLGNSNADATITDISDFTGDFSLDQGSKLSIGSGGSGELVLSQTGSQLYINGIEGATTGAELNVSSLVLGEWATFSFSTDALLDENTASLHLTQGNVSVLDGGSSYIFITDEHNLASGSYLLASGDWSVLDGSAVTIDLGDAATFYSGSVVTDASGLHLSVFVKDGISLWEGSDSQNEWNAENFGTATSRPTSGQTVYFTDAAANKEVNISGAASANSLVFNSTEDYILTTEAGATLTADSLELNDSGKVTLGSGVTISGTTSLAEGSELVVKSFDTLGGAVSGHGTVTIDAGAGEGSESLSGLANLRLLSGRYNVSGQMGADKVEVKGGQLYIQAGGTYNSAVSLSGDGWQESTDDFANAALRLHSSSSAKMVVSMNTTLESDVAVAATGTGEKQLSGIWNGQGHVITKQGSNLLWMTAGNNLQNIGFVAAQGELRLGGSVNTALSESIGAITVKNGAKLSFCANSSTLHGALMLEGGSTIDWTSTGNNNLRTYTFTGDVELTPAATGQSEVVFNSANQRNVVLGGTVSGGATLAIRGNHTNAFSLSLNHTDNTFTGGLIVGLNRQNVTINLAGAGAAGTGAIELGNASALLNVTGNADGSYGQMVNSISGTGKVTLTSGKVELSGQSSYSGGTTVGNDASLKLTNASAAGTGSIALSNAASELVYAGRETSDYGTLANAVTGAGKLKVASGKVALSAESSVGAAEVAQGASLKLSGAASLTVADALTVQSKATALTKARSRAAQVEGVLEKVALTGTAMTSVDTVEHGTVQGASIAVSASDYSMSALELVDSAVLLESTTLSLNDVVLASGSTVTGLSTEASAVLMQDVTLALNSDAYTLVDGSLYGEIYAGKTVAVYTVDAFDNVRLSGNMLMSIPAVAAMTAETTSKNSVADFYAFDFGDHQVTLDNGLTLSANIGTNGAVVEGVQAGNSAYLFEASSDAVPEPASSALALLGLGALALRRRRK